MHSRPLLLEIAVSTPGEAERAVAGGADRLELSSALEVGGLTPSLNAFREVREVVPPGFPIWVLLRPRPGGFSYSASEHAIMMGDAEDFLAEGVAGVVFGVLEGNAIDRPRCRQLVDLAAGHAVFHRAFDLLPDPAVALGTIIELGFERVFTSGGAASAAAGAEALARLLTSAGKRIEILPAGNIRPDNVAALVRTTGCDQVHSSARAPLIDPILAANLSQARGLGADGAGAVMTTSQELVAGLRRELNASRVDE